MLKLPRPVIVPSALRMGDGDSVPMPPLMSSHADKAGNRAHPSALRKIARASKTGGARGRAVGRGRHGQYQQKSPHGRPAPIEPWGEWRTWMARWKFWLPPPEQIIRNAFVVRPVELPREDRRSLLEATMVRPDLLIRIAKEDNWRSSELQAPSAILRGDFDPV
jgi:hypothetical protein